MPIDEESRIGVQYEESWFENKMNSHMLILRVPLYFQIRYFLSIYHLRGLFNT